MAVELTQEEFMSNLETLVASLGPWAARQQVSSPGNIKLRQRKSGELC